MTVRRPEADVHRSKLSLEVASCGFSLDAFRAFRHLLQWADLVHFHFPWPFADVLHLSTSIRRPTVVTYHSDIVRQKALALVYAPLMMKFLRSMDRIVCTSPNYLSTSPVLSRLRDKVNVIPIGLDEGLYGHPSSHVLRACEERYGRDFFLFVGVLRYYKGLHILLDAVRGAPFRVVIVGSGPTETELRQQANRLGLHNVSFAGQVTDEEKVSLIRLSRGIVFPSYMRSEAFGVTLLEGAMHGKPLISTEVGSGTSHVNAHGNTGLVVEPGSETALRDAMEQLWKHPEKACHMGRNARRRYEELFTGDLMGRRYAELYRELTEGRTADAGTKTADGSER